jgi:hypothetical protein
MSSALASCEAGAIVTIECGSGSGSSSGGSRSELDAPYLFKFVKMSQAKIISLFSHSHLKG